ncbi:hypothetical protein ACFLSV_07055 [Bacteroidota bacterium]
MSWQGYELSWEGYELSWEGYELSWEGYELTWEGYELIWKGSELSWKRSELSWKRSDLDCNIGFYNVYFCLDAKVPKNQDCMKMSKLSSLLLRENKLARFHRAQTVFSLYQQNLDSFIRHFYEVVLEDYN